MSISGDLQSPLAVNDTNFEISQSISFPPWKFHASKKHNKMRFIGTFKFNLKRISILKKCNQTESNANIWKRAIESYFSFKKSH